MSYLSKGCIWSYHHHHPSRSKAFNGYQLPPEVIHFVMANKVLTNLVQGYDSNSTFSSHTSPWATVTLLTPVLDFQHYLFSLNGGTERQDVEVVHGLDLLLLSTEHPAPNTMIPTCWIIYSSLDAFLSFATGLLHMLLPLLRTPFLWLLVRLAPSSSSFQDASEVLLSPESLSASTSEVPQNYVLIFIMA